jgi:hypothetical protein
MTCSQAIATLLGTLKGQPLAGGSCDAVSIFYEKSSSAGLLESNSYKGWRSQYLNSVSYIFSLGILGVGIEAASQSIQSSSTDAWLNT